MVDSPRAALAITLLLAGTIWSLPISPARTDTTLPANSSVVPASLRIEARAGTLAVTGHTASASHETAIREAVTAAFPKLDHAFDFEPLGLVPNWWTDASLKLVRALASTTSPSAQLSSNALSVSAIARDPDSTLQRLRSIDAVLPPSVETSLHVLDAGPQVGARELCARHFESFTHRPIKFNEAGTVMRQSAYAVLDRVVALANACREARIAITGHTDSSGSEAYNLHLSQARADTVATYLKERGIAAERLAATGVGSAVPVADNMTRWGRSQNRRIDIRLTNDR